MAPGRPNGDGTVPQFSTRGTWDETDVRPTLLHLVGLRDDYVHDGRVISEILANPSRALVATNELQAAQRERRRVRNQHAARWQRRPRQPIS